MKMVRILFVITLSELGGAQKVVYHLTAGLPPGEFEVDVVCSPGGELVQWLKDLPRGVRVIELPELKRNISPVDDLAVLCKLYALMKREGYQVVHCHSSKAGILGRVAAFFAGVPRILFTVHGWVITGYQGYFTRLFYTWVERLAGAMSTKVICVSEYDRSKGRNLRLAVSQKLHLVYNGMPVSKKRAGALRDELSLKKEDVIIGTVARLAFQKDPLFFLEAADRMLARRRVIPGKGRLYFVLIGDGPLRGECEAFIKNKGLAGHVFLLGTREDAAELVQDFDVFTLFSRWEGLPLTIIEAMLAGRPVVASAVGGVGELVVHGSTGYLIEQGNLDEAVEALLDLACNKERRLLMGEAGRRRAVERFSLKTMVDKYRELYLS